jgi:hypothetical protein
MLTIETPTVQTHVRRTKWLKNGLTVAAIVGLSSFAIGKGRQLYDEFVNLQANQESARKGVVVGYENIHPELSRASKPDNWFDDRGEHTLLWAGWHGGRHEWFKVGRGDITREQISLPLGRDAIQAIDYPILERNGGIRWSKIPDDDLVARFECKGIHAVYPIVVLRKVEVVNDLIDDLPLLVTFRPFVPIEEASRVYEPVLDGKRLTMGLSGYFLDSKPLLYDRGSESLWVERDGSLTAITGPHKGAKLPEVVRPHILPWSDCKSRHPESRLLVGADRSKGKPDL